MDFPIYLDNLRLIGIDIQQYRYNHYWFGLLFDNWYRYGFSIGTVKNLIINMGISIGYLY